MKRFIPNMKRKWRTKKRRNGDTRPALVETEDETFHESCAEDNTSFVNLSTVKSEKSKVNFVNSYNMLTECVAGRAESCGSSHAISPWIP